MAAAAEPGWPDLLTGANSTRSLVLAGGVGLHAVNIFIVTTILPSVVAEIGGLAYYAWNTTLFVVASIVGSAASARALGRFGPRGAYRLAVAVFAFGSLACAFAPSMPALLAGRSLQGLGGGMLVALSYALIRHLFPEALWPRATYAAMTLLVAGTTTIIFVPLLLQDLHGLSPLAAGYLTVVEALGWTGAALATSAAGRTTARRVIAAGPAVMLVGLLGLAWSVPGGGGGLAPIAFWLVLVGAGIGMAWAHLASHALAVAPVGERDLAASSISTVQLLATAFGSALAGMVANLAGLSDPGAVGGTANAARWLFATFAAAPALAGAAVATVLARPAEQPRGAEGRSRGP